MSTWRGINRTSFSRSLYDTTTRSPDLTIFRWNVRWGDFECQWKSALLHFFFAISSLSICSFCMTPTPKMVHTSETRNTILHIVSATERDDLWASPGDYQGMIQQDSSLIELSTDRRLLSLTLCPSLWIYWTKNLLHVLLKLYLSVSINT